jgi:hypothetical protein
VRVEFQGSYRGGSSREQNVFAVPPGVAAEILEINLLGKDVRPGANTGITNGGPTFPLVMSSRIESAAFDMALRARSDFLVRPGVIFSPSIGVFGGRSTDDYDIATFFDRSNVVGGTIANPTSIDARQRTWRFGGDVGADVTLRADTGIAFHFGGRVGINHVRTSLDASDCISTALTLPKGTPCATAPSRFTSSLSTSRNTIGIRTSASGGATINLVYALVGIGGFVSYDTKTPIFQTQTQTSTGFPQTGSPAGIRFVGALSYGGYASIRVPFGL